MFAVEDAARGPELPFLRRMTNLNAFLIGSDDPGDLRAAGEEVP